MKLIASMPKTVKLNKTIVSVGFKRINIKSRQFKACQKAIQNCRSNVERPFGQMELMFAVLETKFHDGHNQLDYLVRFAAAVLLRRNKFYYKK